MGEHEGGLEEEVSRGLGSRVVGGLWDVAKVVGKFEVGYGLAEDIVRTYQDDDLSMLSKGGKILCYVNAMGFKCSVNLAESLLIYGWVNEGNPSMILPVVCVCEIAKLGVDYASRKIADLTMESFESFIESHVDGI